MRTGLAQFKHNLPAVIWYSLLLIVLWQSIVVAYGSWKSPDLASWYDDDGRISPSTVGLSD